MSGESVNSGRKNGRPRKGDPPRVPYEEVDLILVHGEIVQTEDGKGSTVVYPSYRDLARRYGVSHSLIAQYSRKHDCLRRRKEAKARVAVKADQKPVEMRARALAVSKDDALQIIDSYLSGFGEAIAEGRVRFDNPSDFNTMLRLKEFILGGADSRQEIHAALSLEDIQARHQRMLRASHQASAEERGEIIDVLPAPDDDGDRVQLSNSPPPPSEAAAQEVTVHPAEPAARASAIEAPRAPVSARPARSWDDGASGADAAPHGPSVAPTAGSSARVEADTPDEPEDS